MQNFYFQAVGSKLEKFNQKHFSAISQRDLDESEFKIENISEINKKETGPSKYGAIQKVK